RPIRQGIGKVSTENEDTNHNPIETAVKAREETLFPGSLRTTQRRLKQCGFKNCVAAHKSINRGESSLQMNFYKKMNFGTMSCFPTRRRSNLPKLEDYVLIDPGNTRFEENYTLRTTNSGRFSVNVWAWISFHGPGVCWQIDGRLTSEHYTNILENVMLPSVSQVFPENFVFQHF
ncbi:hypothetical protein NQ318_003201, partial [Aromia moschata]